MRRFWIWYENLKEPWDLLFALAFMGTSIGAISFGMVWHKPYLVFSGLLFLLLLLGSRIRFLNREAKSRGFKTSGRRL